MLYWFLSYVTLKIYRCTRVPTWTTSCRICIDFERKKLCARYHGNKFLMVIKCVLQRNELYKINRILYRNNHNICYRHWRALELSIPAFFDIEQNLRSHCFISFLMLYLLPAYIMQWFQNGYLRCIILSSLGYKLLPPPPKSQFSRLCIRTV